MSASAQGYVPISDYGFIGDTCTGALISRGGAIDWCCLPDYDSEPVFAAVLDRMNGGRFHIAPVGEARVTRDYRDGAPILETRFETETGRLCLTDLMPLNEGAERRLEPQREILRQVSVEDGEVEVEVSLDPRPGRERGARITPEGPGAWALRSASHAFLIASEIALEPDEQGLSGRVRLHAGESRRITLGYSAGQVGCWSIPASFDAKLRATEAWWDEWTSGLDCGERYRAPVTRSAQILRMLSFGHSGAVLAAPTTSLPEAPGGQLNWDYRFCWLRDAAFILQAFAGIGRAASAGPFLRWLLHATRMTRPSLAPVYDLYGRAVTHERIRSDFEGYAGAGPVRFGNAAGSQMQLDVYGSVVRAVDHFLGEGGRLDAVERRILRQIGEQVCRVWRLPDNGIWESRGPRRHTTYGKAMCWCALDTLAGWAERKLIDDPGGTFRAEADRIRETLLANAWNERRGAYTAAFGHDDLDAAVLILALTGMVPPDDPRMHATFQRLDAELGRGPLMFRYLNEDGSEPAEGTFAICAFWACEYLALRGEVDAARDRFEKLLALGNDLGLYAEEIAPENGEALGNFPQGLTHVGLINAALAIEKAGERE